MGKSVKFGTLAGALIISNALAGCVSVPDADVDPIDMERITDNLNCELKAAMANHPNLFNKWSSAATLTLKVHNQGTGTVGGSFVLPLTPGFLTIGLGASVSGKASRQEVVEYNPLAALAYSNRCQNWNKGNGQLLTGRVGMAEWLNRFSASGVAGQSGSTVYTAEFIIVKKGNVNPVFSMLPIGKNLLGINADLTVERSDTHTIRMALAKPPAKRKPLEVIVVDYKPVGRKKFNKRSRRNKIFRSRRKSFVPVIRDNKAARDAIQRQRVDPATQ